MGAPFPLRGTVERFVKFVRSVALAFVLVAAALVRANAATEPPAVPPALQAQLLAKVASFDRNLPARARGTVRIALVFAADDPVSVRGAEQARASLADMKTVAGLPHAETSFPFSTAAALRAACESQQLSVVYLSTGLSQHTDAIRAALDGADVLTATSTPSDVQRGIVLGFDAESGRPKLLFNMKQARSQHVEVGADVLRVMKVTP